MRGRIAIIAGAILLAAVSQHAHAVITAPSPLKKFEGDALYIVVGKVEKHFPEMPAMSVVITEDIKGKAPFRKMPINCKVDNPKIFKDNQIEPLLKRFGPDQEIIFFIDPTTKKSYNVFAFTNGTWFHVQGTQVGDKSDVRFSLKSAEPYLRKTFKGTTEELRKILKDHVDKKVPLPEMDEKVVPGFGPEYTPKKGADRRQSPRHGGRGPLFGVIPTLGVGAPLAILALLFPTVFGGVFILFRQWMALITVISLNSTLIFLNIWLSPMFRSSWWSTDAALWIVMTACTFACLLWAWRRQLNALASGEPEAPPKTELIILVVMALSCIGATVVTWWMAKVVSWSDAGWTLTVVLALSILAGTLYRTYQAFKDESLFAAPPMTTEGVVLGTMLFAQVAFIPAIWGSNVNTAGSAQGSEQSGNVSAEVAPVIEKGTFTVDPRFKGMYASTPVIDGDAIYAAYYRTNRQSTLVRLDRDTLKPKWEFFGKDDDLRQMISTPCIAHGKLYFGEGFHYDLNCHVFCVNAEKGEEVWRFQTAGQTESSPAVANGKVYIGAGNDGVYCLDANDGKEIWHLKRDPKARILRFGGGMVVAGNRLYCATGVDREQTVDKGETAVFCLDATNGNEIWRTPAPYAAWSTPILKDGKIFITSGNGDVESDAKAPEIPGGAIQCLNANDGKELWSKRFENGIIESPAVDAHRVYLGCRNGYVYCLRRSDGSQLWERFLEAPIIAPPVLDSDPIYERSLSVFVSTIGGKVRCLTPQKGDDVWTWAPQEPCIISTSPQLVVTRTPDGYRRQLYIGCGVGGGVHSPLDNRPVLYWLEDKVRVE
jgi:outer membrane protein assembly factor BamB